MDFKSADKASVKTPKRSPSVGRKKKDKSAEKAADDLAGIPTPKLTRKKRSSSKEPPKKTEEAVPAIKEEKLAPVPEPEPEPEPVPLVEVADGEINIEVDPEERDPDGKWIIVKKPAKVSTTEGEDVSITIVVAKPRFILAFYTSGLTFPVHIQIYTVVVHVSQIKILFTHVKKIKLC